MKPFPLAIGSAIALGIFSLGIVVGRGCRATVPSLAVVPTAGQAAPAAGSNIAAPVLVGPQNGKSLMLDRVPVYLQSGKVIPLAVGKGDDTYACGKAIAEIRKGRADGWAENNIITTDTLHRHEEFMFGGIADSTLDYKGLSWHRMGQVEFLRTDDIDQVVAEYCLDFMGKGEHLVAIWHIAKTNAAIQETLDTIGIPELKGLKWGGAYILKARPWMTVKEANEGKSPDKLLSEYSIWMPDKPLDE